MGALKSYSPTWKLKIYTSFVNVLKKTFVIVVMHITGFRACLVSDPASYVYCARTV